MSFLEHFLEPTMIWFIIGLICFIVEFSVPGVIVGFFGLGAWVVAVLTYFFKINLLVQLIVFIITSVAALLSLRTRILPKDDSSIIDETDDFIGRTAVVKKTIVRGKPGRVTFKGALWKAITLSDVTLEEGEYVRIAGKESIVLHVEPVKE